MGNFRVGQHPYPWQLTESDLQAYQTPVALESVDIPVPVSPKLPWIPVSCGFLFATSWLIAQYCLLDLGYQPPEDLTRHLPTSKASQSLTIQPAPMRYHLLEAKPTLEAPLPALPDLPSTSNSSGFIPASLTTSIAPLPALPEVPLPPSEPSFQLVGIAEGPDGKIATLKEGSQPPVDVREGEAPMEGYTVVKIHPDYVLLKHGGKTLRVD